MLNKIIATSLLAGLVLLASCASNLPSVKTLTEYQKNEEVAVTPIESYVIGPSDLLSVDVWKEPELSKQVTVRLDGHVSLPLVSDVKAAGLTCEELQSQLTEKYEEYVEAPEVSVTLLESRSKKIYLAGKVIRPGEYVLQKNMTIVQAISMAGGLDQWANASDIRLIRKIKGTEKTFRVDYDAIVAGEDLSQNILLQPDDTIFVP